MAVPVGRVPAHKQLFRDPPKPPGADEDPRYVPVFVQVDEAAGTGSGKFTGPYVPLETCHEPLIHVGWQRPHGDPIAFEAGVAGDPDFRPVFRLSEPPA
ncbi:MAG: hypothetical protein ACLQCU_02500 [Acidimicrobiales bacterium]|jgi:hypothetical protein